jgi:DNA topoisomerase-2
MSLNQILNQDLQEEEVDTKVIIRDEKTKLKKTGSKKKDDSSSIGEKSKETKSKGKEKSKNNENSVEGSSVLASDEECVPLDNLAEKYKKKTQLEHIKDLPDTYIGSIIKETTNVWTFDNPETTSVESSDKDKDTEKGVDNEVNYKIINKEIEYAPGLRSIIEEILVNAFDNMNRVNQKIATEKKRLKKVSYIKVWTNQETGQIAIENDGEGIDVAEHPEYKVYIPQMIFGELLTSGNYNKTEKKITGGKNGYGAKLTNIFSTYFRVETVDRHRKLKYVQEYRNNMDIKGEPEITEYKDAPYTRISFIPDYSKFSMSGLTSELEALIKKRTIDMFACSRGELQVYHNDIPIQLETFTDYMKLYLEPEHLTVSCKPNDRWEIGACLAPTFQFTQISFTNGINTHRGGKHVEYIVKQITKKMVDMINKKKKVDVKESFIRDNLMVFVNATIENPSFDSQTKETLTTLPSNFGSECKVPDAFIEKLAESGIMERALALSQFRESQVLKKTDGVKKARILDIPKLDDAHWAGTKKGDQCTLILTEGDSAKAMAVAGISVIPNGHDLYGIYPLRGKLLNVRDKDDIDVAQNKEICDIKKILALREDTEYKDVSTLRYGRIMLMTDSDVDGSHIKGLIINFLSRWPSLMQLEGFITSLLTPIVKVWKKSAKKGKMDAISFYTLSAYGEWLQAHNQGRGYETKYYKGLGSSTPSEGKEYFKNFKIVTYHWDDLASGTVDMAFNKERADDRKTWLLNYDGNSILDINQSRVSISDFINKDLIHFSNYDNHRSIPSIFDGLKPSTRKIMFCAFKRNLRSEIKVAQLAGYVSEHGAYHHGEASLNGAIVNLAQNYIGTNNINLLMPEGQFGSRSMAGKDYAAPRYIHTYLSKITHILFNKDDYPLLKLTEDDGQKVEPVFYMPIMPLALINGSTGIGTGWSSEIPQFSPLDILNNIRRLMLGQEIVALNPWYRGFIGSIRRIAANQWITKGKYRVLDATTVEITELPIGCWTQDFKNILDMYEAGWKTAADSSNEKKKVKLLVADTSSEKKKSKTTGAEANKPKWVQYVDMNGKLIKSYKNESSESQVHFTITFDPIVLNKLMQGVDKLGLSEFEKLFFLSSKLSCIKTMNLYDENNRLRNFKSPEEILIYYYEHRIVYYTKRRENLIGILEQEVFMLSTRARFILDVINEVIRIRNIPRVEVVSQLQKLGYPVMIDSDIIIPLERATKQQKDDGNYDYLIRMPIYSLTKEKVDELLQEKDIKIKELDTLKSKTDKDLWEADLRVFEIEYKKHLDEFYDYMDINAKEIEAKMAKPATKKVVIRKRDSALPTPATSRIHTPVNVPEIDDD